MCCRSPLFLNTLKGVTPAFTTRLIITNYFISNFWVALVLGHLNVAFADGDRNVQPHAWQPSAGHTQVPIWPNVAPDAQFSTKPGSEILKIDPKDLFVGKTIEEVDNVSQPTMTVYSPKKTNTGVEIVVFPGGGYHDLAIDLEGTEVCDWLFVKGITCVLLKYRVPFSGPHWDEKCNCHIEPKAPMALEDAQRTMRLLRFHAEALHINPHKIGVLGFSSGGNLVAAISTQYDKQLYSPANAADKESCRPDFAVALYPGHMRENTSKEFELNPHISVTSKTPPTFLLQAEDDPVDEVENSIVYYEALKRAGVSVEMHL